ncbi:SDR family oxidoreductase [Silicimonas algicola]|uniref:3-oxoacyl-[acyl-carrier protein] reductase n=1 Tax=Silicimonas algicola TaxID=1826607 RepID=A0A316G3R8_9RHOB|nr:SDR family NAD(P)-dependent oxidoreductase [Silicimonas algicola]AZQ67022.1 SDR family oxidoreductase [Silicimonas algicola]PWK55458.1 3-oxoacyl-[acyl-carrier protein] reductase [Silicimonas algicola]
MNRYDLDGRIAVVTGGAMGIGRAVAHRLAVSGATIALWDLDPDKAAHVAREIDGDAQAFTCDVADWASVAAARDATLARFGRIDILVNSAGIAGNVALVEDYDTAMWDRIMAVNLTGTFHTNKAVIPAMKAQNYGRIVNIASVAGKEGNPKASHYAASKAGVIGFTKAIGKEVATHDIAVNCVTPAAANTPILEQLTEEFIQFMLSKIPRGRFVEVEEIANMVAWLASEECSFTTGAVFDISGGRATY